MPLLFALAALLVPPAHAQEEDPDDPLGLKDIMAEIDLGGTGPSGSDLINYDGSLDQKAAEYVAGKPVTVTHYGGNIRVMCSDREGLTARVSYNLSGTSADQLERYGKGIGVAAWGNGVNGGAKTRLPTKPNSVKSSSIELTVHLPTQATVTVDGGSGWVEVTGCTGAVTVTNKGGAFVSGTLSRVNVSTTGDAKVELTDQSALTGSNKITANGGNVSLLLPMSYGGKFYAKGENVTVYHAVQGSNAGNLVQGTIGSGTASLVVTGGKDVKVDIPK